MSQIQTRMTRQRAVILEELRKTTTHPTADELYGKVREPAGGCGHDEAL